jgi:hypothetical protein
MLTQINQLNKWLQFNDLHPVDQPRLPPHQNIIKLIVDLAKVKRQYLRTSQLPISHLNPILHLLIDMDEQNRIFL